MTKQEKLNLVEELSQKLANTENFYIVDAGTMTVAEVNNFRQACFNKGIEYRVVKNTLIAKALEALNNDVDYADFNANVLKGFSGIMFSEAGNTPAKVLKEVHKGAAKDRQLPALKGASIDSTLFIGADQLETLSNIKSKNELIGDVIGLLQSPAKNVISALKSGQDTIAGVLKTLEERA
ncbi:50S ribosomal protein L10 [Sediminitomix flava]|uniref:Large ribosomal subunit protein uL10 n=1 Tax=Sediminitomix flava TaxID=379075 RepID=A0A316A5E6_SEDFL|nr:50S ribosomal protein L10 [Sediminitomix flava]PWJ44987.1 LSU ribosomal protein L10P [Sediminitomix flava]